MEAFWEKIAKLNYFPEITKYFNLKVKIIANSNSISLKNLAKLKLSSARFVRS